MALYRLRAMLEALRKMGIGAPRLLFTTYTNTRVAYSEQRPPLLLGRDSGFVSVRNVGKRVLEMAGHTVRVIPGDPQNFKITTLMDLATAEARMGGPLA